MKKKLITLLLLLTVPIWLIPWMIYNIIKLTWEDIYSLVERRVK